MSTPTPTAAVPRSPAPTIADTGANTGAATGGVRRLLRAEGLVALVAAATLYAGTGRGWGLFALLFLTPDLTFVAFLAGPRAGAAAYNALHTYVGPLALGLLAHAAGRPALLPFAYLWAAHVAWDRFAGYGLKYATGFGDTHLGRVGRPRGPAPV